MKLELRRIEPLRAASIVGIIYGSIMTVIVVLIIVPMFLLMFAFGTGYDSGGVFSMGILAGLVLLYPLIGAVLGWVTGLVGSACYNVIVRWTGGLLVEADAVERVP